jgi:DNA primase
MQRKPMFKQAAQDEHRDHLEDGQALASLPPEAAESVSMPVAAASAPAVAQPAPRPAAQSPAPAAAPPARDVGPTLVSRIKQKLPLVDYAQRHMQLKAGNTGEYTGKCPDAASHEGGDDKNASFYASSKTDAFLCHACGFSGNVIHLYAFFNGMEYTDAKMQLGRELGVFNERAMDTTESMMLGAARKYIDQLQRKDDALTYLTEVRKITPESMQKFGIGFCWGREYQAMTPQQKAIALSAGLLREASDRGPEKAFMAGRITFPVRDRIGRVVGFGGRLVPSEFKSYGPKYINSPETALFKKSELLYGAYEAAPGIARAGCAVVLEGYVDVVVTHQVGADNTLAVMGASANESTFATLWSMTKRVVFCLDGDAAGAKGTLRSVLAAAPTMPDGCEIAIMTLPAGVDPDEFVLEHGIEAWNELCENAVPLSRFLMEQSVGEYDLSYPEGRAAFIEESKRVAALFAMAPTVGEQIVAEARALNASGLVAYALTSNDIGDNVETQLLRDAIALLQRTVASRAAAATQAAPTAAAAPTDAAASTAVEPDAPTAERARPSRRP